MTYSDMMRFSKLLYEIIQFVRKKGGNKDTYVLNKLMECKDNLIKAYPQYEESINKNF